MDLVIETRVEMGFQLFYVKLINIKLFKIDIESMSTGGKPIK